MRATRWMIVPVLALMAACGERQPTGSDGREPAEPALPRLECVAAVHRGSVSCTGPATLAQGARAYIGGQGVNVRISSANVSYDSATRTFSADVAVMNLMAGAMGTEDGETADPEGIRVFFHTGPDVTSGSGTVYVSNADGKATFTGGDQPFFRYPVILNPGWVTSARRWTWHVDPTVVTFAFTLLVEAKVSPVPVASRGEVVSGGDQAAAPGQPLPLPLAIRVVDYRGNPMPGVTVWWNEPRTAADPSPADTMSVTDSAGVAATRWVLGNVIGRQELRGTVWSDSIPEAGTKSGFSMGGEASAEGIRIASPYPNPVYREACVDVKVEAHFRAGITALSASTGGTTVALEETSHNADPDDWEGDICPAQTGGQRWLVIRATLGDSTARADSMLVKIDRYPTITVTRPTGNEYMVRDPVEVEARCEDDGGCLSLELLVDDVVVAAGTDRVSATVPVPDGREVTMRARARDAGGPWESRSYIRASESSPRWRFPAALRTRYTVFDFDGHRLLASDSLRDVTAGTSIQVRDQIPVRLLPRGYMATQCVVAGRFGLVCTPWEVRADGGETQLTTAELSRPRLRGSWLLVNDALWNMANGTRTPLVTDTVGDVAANGDVVWSRADSLFRFRAGMTTRLAAAGTFPVTDGRLVVFRAQSGGGHRIEVLTETGDVVPLSTPGSRQPLRDRDYRVRDGWVAFLTGDAGRELWTRSPSGDLRKAAVLGADAELGEMGPDGIVLVTSGGRRYVVRPGGAPVDIGARGYLRKADIDFRETVPVMRWVDGVLYALVANEVFRIDF